MKKLIGIALLICLVAPFAGGYFYLRNQAKRVRKEVKHQIMAGIDKEELVLLAFTKEEEEVQLKWKHSKEFEYKNQMYDIVSRDTLGDTIQYWCWWDYEETKLNKQLYILVQNALGNNPKRKDRQRTLLKLYKSLYFNDIPPQEIKISILKQKYFELTESAHSLSFTPPTPPPIYS